MRREYDPQYFSLAGWMELLREAAADPDATSRERIRIKRTQSVVGLFNAIGISAVPLAGKGFRINENTIKEHVDARGLDQAAYQRLLKLKNGDVITPEQMKDYASIATGVYRDTYINAANEERRQLGYIDVLPLGNNEVVDQVTGSLYLKVAGGDRAKAEAALKKSGWRIPQ